MMPSEEPTAAAAEQRAAARARRSCAQRIEEQLRKVRVQDLLLESVVSVLNLTARRIAKEDERDLEQARVGIEAVRAVVDLLDDEPAKQVRSALSEMQMLYAKHAEEGEPGGSSRERRRRHGAAGRRSAGPRAGRRAAGGASEALDAARERCAAAPLDSARFAARCPLAAQLHTPLHGGRKT